METSKYDLGICITDFMERYAPAKSFAAEARATLIDLKKAGKETAVAKAVGELVEWIHDLEEVERHKFIAFSIARGIAFSFAAHEGELEKLLKQKSVKTDAQYRVLREFVERSHFEIGERDRAHKAQLLIDAYEAKKRRRS